ncbi:MAG: biotin/lipoyl-binding protein [Bacteroidales bacterium]|nr:biotin/lipoyl-binding protein [Bacteroidales bacterium]
MKAYKFKINGNAYDVAVNGIEGRIASVTVNGKDYEVELEDAPAAESSEAAPVQTVAAAPRHGEGFVGKVVRSPLPGVLIELNVREGQNVRRGQKLAVLEAMKMENEILAETDGVVKEVFVQKGDSVLEGAKIVSIG